LLLCLHQSLAANRRRTVFIDNLLKDIKQSHFVSPSFVPTPCTCDRGAGSAWNKVLLG
jgi:hypothetical protein